MLTSQVSSAWAETILNPSFGQARPSAAPSSVPVSDETQALRELLQACDKTLVSCQATVKKKDAVILQYRGLVDEQGKRISDLESSEGSLVNNRFVWFLLGVGAAALTVKLVK